MAIKIKRGFICIATFGIFLTLMLSGCTSSNHTISTTVPYYWQESPDGTIQTNDFQRLQKEIPFTIILPKYLPQDIPTLPPELSKNTGEYADKDVDIKIQYSASPNSIIIEEVNLPITFISPEDPQYANFNVNNINVSEDQFLRTVSDNSGQPINKIEFEYSWHKNNISFDGRIIGYNQTESRKIIESMIK